MQYNVWMTIRVTEPIDRSLSHQDEKFRFEDLVGTVASAIQMVTRDDVRLEVVHVAIDKEES